MLFYRPQFQIASMQPPQTRFVSKFGGLPWGLPLERWRRCRTCGRRMSLLAQLLHDPPALDLGAAGRVLHLFQCQACFGYNPDVNNCATFEDFGSLGETLTPLPEGEDLSGIIVEPLGCMVGELWITGWIADDDGLDPSIETRIYSPEAWTDLCDELGEELCTARKRTRFGGVPFWTVHGPQGPPRDRHQFPFQLDNFVEFTGPPPTPDQFGGLLVLTKLEGSGADLRISKQEYVYPSDGQHRENAPWYVEASGNDSYSVSITNFGTDGTAYVFLNRQANPPTAYWYWSR